MAADPGSLGFPEVRNTSGQALVAVIRKVWNCGVLIRRVGEFLSHPLTGE